MNGMENIKGFIDEGGKVRAWPAKRAKKLDVLRYMSTKFETGRKYTEREANELIDHWHTFGDLFLLRREMVDAGYLHRTANGSAYWREE